MTARYWKKYEKLKEIDNSQSNIKTYLARIEPIVKEIKPKDKDDFIIINQKLEELKNEIKIYDMVEEDDLIYIVL